jgi:predicted transcriptional regulator
LAIVQRGSLAVFEDEQGSPGMRRLPMRKISEALRLKAAGLSTRKIAVSLNVGQSTVSEYLKCGATNRVRIQRQSG